jgi:5-hydroxyisourate hydrolase
MSAITTSILDATNGCPGAGITVTLERKTHTAGWQAIADGMTDINGRLDDLLSITEPFLPGHYRLIYEIGPYFLLREIVVKDPTQRFHIPLLLSPFGYSTYRSA